MRKQILRVARRVGCGLAFFLICTVSAYGQTQLDQAHSEYKRGITAYNAGNIVGAQRVWSDALDLFRAIKGTERQQADCHIAIGVALGQMGQYEAVIQCQEQALGIYIKILGTEREQAYCHVNIGNALQLMGQYEADIQRQEQALGILRKIQGTEREQAGCHGNIGVALILMGKYEEAIARQEQALGILRKIQGTEREQAACHGNIGAALGQMGQYEADIQRQEQALGIYRKIPGTEREQAACHGNIGVALDDMGKYEEAIARQEQALGILRKIQGTEREQAACHGHIGVALWQMGKYEEAIARQEQALGIYRKIPGTERDQADCHGNIGVALILMGKYEEAIARQEQAMAMYRAIKGTELDQAGRHVNIGAALLQMGKYEEAIARQEQALAMLRAIKGTERDQGTCWGNIGESLRGLKRYADAIKAYEEIGGTGWWILRGLALAHHARGEPGDEEKAIEHLLRAASEAEQARTDVLATEHRIGTFERRAVVFSDLAALLVALARDGVQVDLPGVTQWAEGTVSQSALPTAAFHFIEQGKGRGLEDALRKKPVPGSERLEGKLLAEDQELSRRISKLSSLREGLTPAEAERKKKLGEEIDALQLRRNMIEVEEKRGALGGYVAPEFRRPMEMARELESGRAVLQYSVGEEECLLLLMTRDGVTAHQLGAPARALPELFARQEATPAQLAEAWKKRPEKIGLDGLVRLARMRAEDLGKREAERHNLLDASQEQAILRRLGEVVLPAGALAELRAKGVRELVVIPDGALHYVPFAMLRLADVKGEREHYLVEEFAASYTPSMATLEAIRKQASERGKRRQGPRGELLAFANPDFGAGPAPAADDMLTRLRSFRHDYYAAGGLKLISLPETEQEAVRVASLFGPPKVYRDPAPDSPAGPAQVCVRNAAGEEQVKRWLGAKEGAGGKSWRYLLFSTHGLADPRDGMLSCLALSIPGKDSTEDGYLQAQEIIGLRLDADLVMLSACQTGLGRLRGGEGLVGLGAAFFIAGTESVCASLWQVPTGPTGQLVTEFFKNLKEGKMDRAEALRQAQLIVLQAGRDPNGKPSDYSSPFCWAAFVLMGEYRASPPAQ